jgi:diketogulonate reductase-like aldo/keto reductase
MVAGPMNDVALANGECVPVVGQGTWRMGEDKHKRDEEVAALRLGIALGLTVIDTAEMYGEGGAEMVVADAIEDRRDRVFIVTKVYPQNASRKELPRACERSLKRLRIDAIDLYLLHWRGEVPLDETVGAFERLRTEGKINGWGVSNFDVADIEELWRIPEGRRCATNQVLYNLENRGIEFDLLSVHQHSTIDHEPIVMAYSPVGHGRGLLQNGALKKVADRHRATPAQIALAWVVRKPGVVAIPKSSNQAHVRENAIASDIRLTKEDLADLDRAFPPPKAKVPLAML